MTGRPKGKCGDESTADGHARHAWLALAAVIGLGAIPRLLVGDSNEVWLNEAFSLLVARLPWADLLEATANDVHPPLHYALLAALDRSALPLEAAGRALSFGLSLALIPLSYRAARYIFGRRGSLLVSALVALSPALCSHATELRMYPLAGVLAAGLLVCALGLVRDGPRRGSVVLVAALTCLSLYTHYFFVPYILALTVGVLVARPGRRPALVWCGAAIAGAVLWAPWVMAFTRSVGSVEASFWTERVSALQGLREAKALWGGLLGIERGLPYVPDVTERLARVAVLLLAGVGAVGLWRARPGRCLPVAVVVFLGSLVLVSATKRNMLVLRSLLIVAPIALMLVVAGVRAVPGRWRLTLCIVLLSLPLPRLGTLAATSLALAPLPAMVDVVSRFGSPDDVCAHTSMWTYYPFRWMSGEDSRQALLLPSNLSAATARVLGEQRSESEGALEGAGRVWLVVTDDPLHEGRDLELAKELCRMHGTMWRGSFGRYELVLLSAREHSPSQVEERNGAVPEGAGHSHAERGRVVPHR